MVFFRTIQKYDREIKAGVLSFFHNLQLSRGPSISSRTAILEKFMAKKDGKHYRSTTKFPTLPH